MRAHQIMQKSDYGGLPLTPSLMPPTSCWRTTEWAPIDETGKLIGIVSQGDFIRRAEPGACWGCGVDHRAVGRILKMNVNGIANANADE